jgi:hypothetical protein
MLFIVIFTFVAVALVHRYILTLLLFITKSLQL